MKKIIAFILFLILIGYIYFIFINNEDQNQLFLNKEEIMEVHFINMGRNDAIVIKTYDNVIVIDGGRYRDGDIIVEYLKTLDITHIDALIGSHMHFNHIQAHARILQNFTVDKLYYPHELELCLEEIMCDTNDIRYILDEINNQNKIANIMRLNDVIEIGPMKIKVLGPIEFGTFEEHHFPQNFNSLNFILTFGNTRFFFTGDGMQEENILLKFSEKDLRVDMFQHPYHGEQSLSQEFIERISPRYVIETHHTSQLANQNQRNSEYYDNIGATTLYFNTNENIIFLSDGYKVTFKRQILEQILNTR